MRGTRRGLVVIENVDDDEFAGISRVLLVLSKVPARTLRKVQSALDHKGLLCVQWRSTPDVDDLSDLEGCWFDTGERQVEHDLPDKSVIYASLGHHKAHRQKIGVRADDGTINDEALE